MKSHDKYNLKNKSKRGMNFKYKRMKQIQQNGGEINDSAQDFIALSYK